MRHDLIVLRPEGLYCPAGDFFIDPWRPVDRAIITHAHADHARTGHRRYLASAEGERVLRARLGDITLQTLTYGERIHIGDAAVSLHPAGHVLGSAQVRVEVAGEVWVASGDYKLEPDATCTAFDPVRAHAFITESTFGLPIYRWPAQDVLLAELNEWWRGNADAGRASVVFAYAFGKSQRILAGLDPAIGPIVCHGAVEALNRAYRDSGVALPAIAMVSDGLDAAALRRALVLAPPSAQSTPWMKRFGDYADCFASGWMRVRGARRRRGVDRGLVMSDHADWPGLLGAIGATGASRVIVTHGHVAPLVRWLTEQGIEAGAFRTAFGQEAEDEAAAPESAATAASQREAEGGQAGDEHAAG